MINSRCNLKVLQFCKFLLNFLFAAFKQKIPVDAVSTDTAITTTTRSESQLFKCCNFYYWDFFSTFLYLVVLSLCFILSLYLCISPFIFLTHFDSFFIFPFLSFFVVNRAPSKHYIEPSREFSLTLSAIPPSMLSHL